MCLCLIVRQLCEQVVWQVAMRGWAKNKAQSSWEFGKYRLLLLRMTQFKSSACA